MSKDYYKILNVSKSSSPDEIKKGFRTLAHQFHPDKPTGNADKFKEINEAYQVLGDEQKRKQYDQYGSDFSNGGGFGGASGFDFSGFQQGFGGQGGNVNFDMGDLGEMFGDMFGFGGGRSAGPRVIRGEDVEVRMNLEFKEAIFGITKELNLSLQRQCKTCVGTGGEPNSKKITCTTCKGSGQVASMRRTILGQVQSISACSACDGQGSYYEKKCHACGVQGRVKSNETIKFDIPAGIDNGMTMKLTGKGNAGPNNGPSGDLYVKITVKQDDHFNREDENIFSIEEIPFSLAVFGGKTNVLTVDGDDTLKIPSGTASGTEFVIKGKGAAKFQRHGRGDHFVTIHVAVPKDLTREQKEGLKRLEGLGL